MESKVIELLVELCEDEAVREDLDMDLFEEGLLDSLAFAELLFSIEENFGVVLAPSEVERTEINTANKIINLMDKLFL